MENKKQKKQLPKEVGRWTKQQHQKFVQGLMIYGKNWKKVEEVVCTRTAAQVRSHAQKFFNRLDKQQKKTEGDNNSQTEFVGFREHEENITQQTPQNIVSLIRQQSKKDKSVNVSNLINTLKNQTTNLTQNIQKKKASDEQPKHIQSLEKERQQLNSMTNLVSAFSNLSEQPQKDESFFLSLLKKYKKYISDNKFIDLIDIPHYQLLGQDIEKCQKPKQRKRSFSLVQNSDQNIEHYNKLRKLIKNDEKKQQTCGLIKQNNNESNQSQEIRININIPQ